MSVRTVTPWKRANSTNFWFRMAVPERYRAQLGKSEIKQTLGTTTFAEAQRMCLIRQAEWLARFREIDAQNAENGRRKAMAAVETYINDQCHIFGSPAAFADSERAWLNHAESVLEHLRSSQSDRGLDAAPTQLASDALDSSGIRLRREALGGTSLGQSILGHESATRALERRVWSIAQDFVCEAFDQAGLQFDPASPDHACAAEYYLKWLLRQGQEKVEAAQQTCPAPPRIVPSIGGMCPVLVPAEGQAGRPQPLWLDGNVDQSISSVFDVWAQAQPPERAKLVDEWRLAIRRFVSIFGNVDVRRIDAGMMMYFRETLCRLPRQPTKEVGAQTPQDQIRIARERHLPTLSNASVQKAIAGLRVVLGHAIDPLCIISVNPAFGIKPPAAGADSRPRLALDANDLRSFFHAPDFLDPNGLADAEFWVPLACLFMGLRIEEASTLRPRNVRQDRGIWMLVVERDIASVEAQAKAEGRARKRGKTKSALREIAIPSLLLQMGFVEFALQKAGRDWIFEELKADKYGSRGKELSRRINRRIRRLGIEQDKCFHSTRHSMKRAARESDMKEEIADVLAGHSPGRTGRLYGAGISLAANRAAIDRLDFGIDWQPVILAAQRRLANT